MLKELKCKGFVNYTAATKGWVGEAKSKQIVIETPCPIISNFRAAGASHGIMEAMPGTGCPSVTLFSAKPLSVSLVPLHSFKSSPTSNPSQLNLLRSDSKAPFRGREASKEEN